MPITDEKYIQLLKENERLKLAAAPVPGSRTHLYVGAVIALSIIGVAAIVLLVVLRPETDNTANITLILGFLVPMVTALLAASVQQVHLAVNSRLTQLLQLTKQSSEAEGKLAGIAEEAGSGTTSPSVSVSPDTSGKVIVPALIGVWISTEYVVFGLGTAVHALLITTLVITIIRLLSGHRKV